MSNTNKYSRGIRRGAIIGLLLLPFTWLFGYRLSMNSIVNVDKTPIPFETNSQIASKPPEMPKVDYDATMTVLSQSFPEIESLRTMEFGISHLVSTDSLNSEYITGCVNLYDAIFIKTNFLSQKDLFDPVYPYYIVSDYCGAWSPDGKKIAQIHDWKTILIRKRGEFNANVLIDDTILPSNIFNNLTWSPNSSELIFTSSNFTDNSKSGTYLLHLSSSNQVLSLEKISDQNFIDVGFSWSPDGEYIAGVVWKDDKHKIIIISTKGELVWQSPDDMFATGSAPTWSPDSKQIIFTAYSDDSTESNLKYELTKVNVQKNKLEYIAINLSTFGDFHWSPDGVWLLFGSSGWQEGDYTDRLYRCKPDGTELMQIAHSEHIEIGQWSPDGKSFFFVETIKSGDTKRLALYIVDINHIDLAYQVKLGSYPDTQFFFPAYWLPSINN